MLYSSVTFKVRPVVTGRLVTYLAQRVPADMVRATASSRRAAMCCFTSFAMLFKAATSLIHLGRIDGDLYVFISAGHCIGRGQGKGQGQGVALALACGQDPGVFKGVGLAVR